MLAIILILISLSASLALPSEPLRGLPQENRTPVVEVPGGEFIPLYGSKKKTVSVDAFVMDRFPVTLQQFEKFLEANPKWIRNRAPKIFIDKTYLSPFDERGKIRKGFEPDAPVTFVSWYVAKAYCEWMEQRLPTVNEWEYVASRPIPGKEIKRVILDWYSQPTPERLPSVKSGLENTSGISCLHGLIWEWTLDYGSTMISGENRGSDSLDKMLFCGSGSLGSADPSDYAAFLRFGLRSSLKSNFTLANLGFRCVKEKEKPRP